MFNYRGKKYSIEKSNRKNKQLKVNVNGKIIHFGDPKMPEYPNTKRGDNYCARSFGILDKKGNPTRKDINSPNFWSRKVLWNCVGKKSKKK